MKQVLVLVASLLASSFATTAARAQMAKEQLLYELRQDMDRAFSLDETGKQWTLSGAVFDQGKANCQEYLERLAKLAVPGTTTVMLERDGRDLKAGEHSLDELRPACLQVVKYGKIADWERWAIEAMRDNARITSGQRLETTYMQNCLSTYDTMLKAGVAPTDLVLERQVNDNDGKPVTWSGSVAELRKKWCEVGLAKVNEKLDEQDAPFKKVLKADKLKDALTYRSFWLVGGRTTADPKVMAKANVLFTDSSPSEYCVGNGLQVHVLTRLQYNGAHKLIKVTRSNHCGNPPAKAYK
jgi:hypothetical protein